MMTKAATITAATTTAPETIQMSNTSKKPQSTINLLEPGLFLNGVRRHAGPCSSKVVHSKWAFFIYYYRNIK